MSSKTNNYYEVLDVSFNATPEAIRTSYIRAKNAYNRDSLAAYSLFSAEESQRILNEIEEAYTVLSDTERRRRYDESHGILTSDTSHYHSSMPSEHVREPFSSINTTTAPSITAKTTPTASPIDRLKSMQEGAATSLGAPRPFTVNTRNATDPEMEREITECREVNGTFLRKIREYKGVSPEEIIDVLKISKNYLTALEEDITDKLPANVFVRGFVIQYAKALKIDPNPIAAKYMDFLRSRRP